MIAPSKPDLEHQSSVWHSRAHSIPTMHYNTWHMLWIVNYWGFDSRIGLSKKYQTMHAYPSITIAILVIFLLNFLLFTSLTILLMYFFVYNLVFYDDHVILIIVIIFIGNASLYRFLKPSCCIIPRHVWFLLNV